MALLVVIPQGQIGGVTIDATFEEIYTDEVEATEHPVELGAPITDHSYSRPTGLVLRCGWSNSSPDALINEISGFVATGALSVTDYVSGIYAQLLAMQRARQTVDVTTTLRTYTDLLIRQLRVTRDQKTSQALMVEATLREAIIVSTQSTTLPPVAAQANPSATQETANVGTSFPVSGTPSPGGAADPSTWGGTPSNGSGSPAAITAGM